MQTTNIYPLIFVAAVMFAVIGGITLFSHWYSLNRIKNKTVGDGQHGTARWASKKEIHTMYKEVPFTPKLWRNGVNLPKVDEQGIIVGTNNNKVNMTALVDTGDVHALMIGAAGVWMKERTTSGISFMWKVE